MSKLDSKTSVAVGLGAMGLVWGIYGQVVPKVADLRVSGANDRDAAAAEKAARWASGGAVVALSLITRDATVFILGGSAVVLFSWLHRHANAVDPMTKTPIIPSSRMTVHAGDGLPVGYSPSA
jgi:hypothetical protein